MTFETTMKLNAITIALSCFSLGVQLGACGGSQKLPTPTVEQKQTAADAKYAEQLLACVRDHKGGGEPAIDDCAADVRARWGVDGGAR